MAIHAHITAAQADKTLTPVMVIFPVWQAARAEALASGEDAAAERQVAIEAALLEAPSRSLVDLAAKIAVATDWGRDTDGMFGAQVARDAIAILAAAGIGEAA